MWRGCGGFDRPTPLFFLVESGAKGCESQLHLREARERWQVTRLRQDSRKRANEEKLTILVIDDDESLRNSVRRTLKKMSYMVLEAAEGRQGLTVLKTQTVDLILLDIFMPDKEGLETLTELHRSYPGIKVIVMSGGGAKGGLDVLKIARMLGAQRTLAKPFTQEELIEAVKQLLAGNQLT